MKVPYGIKDFKSIRKQNFIFVDKTRYIETLEKMEQYMLFLRPRRFGKTLFTSVLEYYYDILYKEEFDELFRGLYIGEHKTENANSYQVLRFDFSGIETDLSNIKKNFANCVKIHLKGFVDTHKLDIKIDMDSDDSSSILRAFLENYKITLDKKIFLIIDEYDHFANDVLSDDRGFFNHMTSKDGFVRKFYEVFKIYTGNVIERIFITGVTTITLDSLTSGFNISRNIGNRDELNEMIGFTEEEVRCLLRECCIDEKYIEILQEYYNGYLFSSEGTKKVYNSNLLMYFLIEYNRKKKVPKNLIDSNVISDYTKITKLFDLYEDEVDRKVIIEDIVSGNPLIGIIKDNIGPLVKVSNNVEDEKRLGFTRNDFISLLYYLGLLTISGSVGLEVSLTPPNYCISSVYSKYYLSYLYQMMNAGYVMEKEIGAAMRDLTMKNDLTKFKDIVEKMLRGIGSQDYIEFDEKYVKLMMYSVASYSEAYLIKTEWWVENLRADLVLLPNYSVTMDNYYVFEVKYLKKKDYTEKALENERKKAVKQVIDYANTEDMKNIPNLRKYVVIAVKDELKVFEEVIG